MVTLYYKVFFSWKRSFGEISFKGQIFASSRHKEKKHVRFKPSHVRLKLNRLLLGEQ
jgi:hypothetical protein